MSYKKKLKGEEALVGDEGEMAVIKSLTLVGNAGEMSIIKESDCQAFSAVSVKH